MDMTEPYILNWLQAPLDQCRELTLNRHSTKRWTKASTDGTGTELVTEIDLAIDSLLTEAIREHMPDAAVLSEESNPDPSALAADTRFVIDPIDGTKELVDGRPGF